MHPSVMDYVQEQVQRYQLRHCSTLEVGSYDVNGSVRPLFIGGEYIGVDMRSGPGVDFVMSSHYLSFYSSSFDVVVSTEMLEHDDNPDQSVREMARVLGTGGLLILTARGYDERGCFPVHDYPADYWRFSVEGARKLLERHGLEVLDCRADPEAPGFLATARKR